MRNIKYSIFSIILLLFPMGMQADIVRDMITGVVIDAENGDTLMSVVYKYADEDQLYKTDYDGGFMMKYRQGATITFSCVGYEKQNLLLTKDTPDFVTVYLKAETHSLAGVTVKAKKIKYSRKDNPAVELMRRIIKANKKENLKSNDFYEFYKYQKVSLAKNNVNEQYIDSLRKIKSKQWMTDQVELCPLNNKLIMPIQTNETVTRCIYRKSDGDEKNTVLGKNENGIMNQLSTIGDAFNVITKQCFVDIDVYENQILFLDQSFISPIGSGAIDFYHFYINDTIQIDNKPCFDIFFTPNNNKDIGFSGHIYAFNDSTLHLRRLQLKLPHDTGVNYVNDMMINQEFVQLPDGQWVLDSDDMLAEISLNKIMTNGVVIRRTKYSNYSFEPIAKSQFRGTAVNVVSPESTSRTEDFWDEFRTLKLTQGEKNVNDYAHSFFNRKGWRYVYPIIRTISDNYLETSFKQDVPSKFDFGPINTLVGNNVVDGWRVRLSARTNTALNHHIFWQGFVAYGFGSKNTYYESLFTYSFNRKDKQPWEFPIRQIRVGSTKSIMTPYDKFLLTNNDNWMTSIHVKKLDKYYIYNQQNVSFQWETQAGLCTTAEAKAVSLMPAAAMTFRDMNGNYVNNVRTMEFTLGFRYAPGETYLNTKQRRYPLNADAPVFMLTHTMSVKDLLGSDYASNYTEASIQKRFWPGSWGKFDIYIAGKAQWNKVPFPLLIMPSQNLSWITQHDTHTFELMNNMEFLTDRTLQWQVAWNLNGKILNRIPLIRHLEWREIILFRGMWGKLTDKNNPKLAQNANDKTLMFLPVGCTNELGKDPYMEVSVGIHNILKLLEVDYVYRINYRDLDTAIKWGIRFGFNFSF